jgi:hypothetical protein
MSISQQTIEHHFIFLENYSFNSTVAKFAIVHLFTTSASASMFFMCLEIVDLSL